MENPKPLDQHRWLQRFVGEWAFEGSMKSESNEETPMFSGTERVRALGEVWIVAEGKIGDAESQTTLGYDPAKGRFQGSFITTMLTWFWSYDGTLEGDALTLESEGPSMKEEGKLALYRDVYALDGDDRRSLTAYVREDDGTWTHFMTTTYRRTG